MLNPNIVKFNGTLGKAHLVDKEAELYVFQAWNQKYWNSATDERHPLSDFDKTSFDDQISFIKKTFVWGKVVDVHTIGDYQIIEYLDKDRTLFHSYINFSDTNHSTTSLDKALIDILSVKYDGPNSQAGLMFVRMLGLDKEDN